MKISTKTDQALLRVLFLTRKWPPAAGGMETYSQELAKELAPLVHLTVHALAGRRDRTPPTLPALTVFLIMSLFFLFYYRKDFDAVHFGDMVLFPLAWWHSLIAPRSSRFITVHGLDLIYGKRKGLKPTIYSLFISWAKKRRKSVAYYISNSRNTRTLCENEGFKPVKTIRLGVRLNSEYKYERPDFIRDEKYILFAGRLVRRKGCRWFAENVLPELPKDIVLYVAGKVWDAEEGKALKNNPRVKMLGYISKESLNATRHNALAVIMPNIITEGSTDVEGFGIAALEATACGAPLVASDIEGLRDAVKHEETGFLVRAGDINKWKTCLEDIFEWNQDKKTNFQNQARQKLERCFSWKRVAEDTLQIYKRVRK